MSDFTILSKSSTTGGRTDWRVQLVVFAAERAPPRRLGLFFPGRGLSIE